jgi:maltose alpha-D-glucosyltransferase/alpha-amylase
VLGSLSYQREEQTFAVGILQSFVRNEGDAWKYTLEQLAGFFKLALASASEPPRLRTEHPLELVTEEIPAEVGDYAGDYLASAALLALRTAEMHAALADPRGGPDFAPEPFTEADAQQLHRELIAQADITFELLRRKQASLRGAAAEAARQVLHLENRVAERFRVIETQRIATVRIRHHGDYHLGQVLYTGRDFMIIDFEGEPARPLVERRAKALALRDVAGMVRSFQYAAFAALFGQVPGVDISEESRARIESWAAVWNAYVSATYLGAYFEAAEGKPFVPTSMREGRILLDAFLLQKALYEVAYELNNRPDWLQIPLMGILSLIR